LVTGNWWRVIVNFKNYSSTGWENSIALALSAKDVVPELMLNDRSFCGTYGALLLTFYHDIPCDRLFSEILKKY
jgi:hypothetical protein